MSAATIKYNSFTLRAKFVDASSGVGADITFTCAADTLLNDPDTLGEVKVFVAPNNTPSAYVTTNDGASNHVLDGTTYAFAQSLNGAYVYYTLWGGLPDGVYVWWFEMTKKSSGTYHPRLSTDPVTFQIKDGNVTFA
jgi:hypothetical protein